MSPLIRAFAAPRAMVLAAPSRSFSVYAMRLKESDLGNPDTAAQYEIHKQDLLRKVKEGRGHWKPELASDSEEAVAAERYYFENKTETLEELQRRTVQHAAKKHKHGTSQDTGM